MESAAKVFFSSTRFAVAGASQDSSKFGYKVLAWYHAHSLPVTPINPRAPQISLPSQTYSTVSSPSALTDPKETSLSIITPPPATLKILKEAKEVGIPAVWLQPGSFDEEGLEYAKKEFQAGVGGDGWCVLVDGENAMRASGKEWKMQKL
ncbi:MAG: hypothetical protein M1834_000047 [Cirrosporium novae-zelandiae]|nr:MAG: hypothetical protein M1834_000047 [Cirrosporium novae-zelandiae]